MSLYDPSINTAHEERRFQTHATTSSNSRDSAAVLSLALALTSIVIPVLPAVVALFLAHGAKKSIASNGLKRDGAGLAFAAQVISALTLALAVFAAIVFAMV